ncbi:hypothetical protein C8F04DRAFT_1180792 [Mycena alexandri]|uniref:Secreted protein n=1 Tax=Mycena alexandri TaxID=1745969 RepID=A0AAD6T0U2_9AGAR|nr:hypothetical protein C8F04DRAFT_1180792 [Mycena alexandri]
MPGTSQYTGLTLHLLVALLANSLRGSQDVNHCGFLLLFFSKKRTCIAMRSSGPQAQVGSRKTGRVILHRHSDPRTATISSLSHHHMSDSMLQQTIQCDPFEQKDMGQPNDQTPSERELRAGQNGTRDRGRMMKIGGLDDTTRQVMRERTALVFGDRQRDEGRGLDQRCDESDGSGLRIGVIGASECWSAERWSVRARGTESWGTGVTLHNRET